MAKSHLESTAGKLGIVDKDYALDGRAVLYLAAALSALAGETNRVVAVGNFSSSESKNVFDILQSFGVRQIHKIWEYLTEMWAGTRLTQISA